MGGLLVIEDSITIRKLVELAFRGTNVPLDFAGSGAEGLSKLRTGTPRVVLMDYVLPDMKGIEICTRIANSDGTKPHVIVMSARMEDVRAQFAPFSFVGDFVSKPFKATDIVGIVTGAMGRESSVELSSTPTHSLPPPMPSAEREAAAFALFAQLRPKLAQIPGWMSELGDTPPAKFFARKVLTPDVVDRMIESLLPVLRDRVRRLAPITEAANPEALLEGRIGTLSPYEILAVAQRLQRTGELIVGAHGEIITYLRDGRIVLTTSHDATEWSRELALDLSGVPPEGMRKAHEEQSASGKPLLVTLAELGNLPRCDLSGLLNEQGKRLLKRVLGRFGPGTPFAFRARPTLPLYVDAYGRGLWFRQVLLERLRDDPADAGEVVAATADTIFERRGGFSKRLLQFELVPSERRVLALVDGATAARNIALRTGLEVAETCSVLQRLESVELVVRRESSRNASEAPPSLVSRQVMILEPDVESFQRPLERLLSDRPGKYSLVTLAGEEDVFAAIRRTKPALVILNVTTHGAADCARTARAVRASDELRDLLLVAVLELPSAVDEAPLSEAGFDAILSKPVSYSDLERLLVA